MKNARLYLTDSTLVTSLVVFLNQHNSVHIVQPWKTNINAPKSCSCVFSSKSGCSSFRKMGVIFVTFFVTSICEVRA